MHYERQECFVLRQEGMHTLLRIIYNLRRGSGESPEVFNKRLEQGKWSIHWARSVCFWAAHVLRNRADGCWSNRVLAIRSSHELAQRRSLNQGRPRTRNSPGFCCRRWTDGVDPAFKYLKSLGAVPDKLYDQLDELLQSGLPHDQENWLLNF